MKELKHRADFERLWDWKPSPQQIMAFESAADEVWCFGGNRSGKTELVCAVMAMFAHGIHPVRSKIRKPPVYIRHCATDWSHGVGTLIKKYQHMIPRHWLKGQDWGTAWSEKHKSIFFANGSVITFRAFEQEINKFGADDLDAVAQDEHGPEAYYLENRMRLADRNGFLMAAMTPEFGVTWEEEHVTNPVAGLEIDHFFLNTEDNPHLSKTGVEKVKASIKDPGLADTKLHGHFVPLTGRVIPTYDAEKTIIPDIEIPSSAIKVMCIDLHTKTPSAALWGAWLPSQGREGFDFVVYRTHKALLTVNEWKKRIVELENGERIDIRLGDESERETGEKGIWNQDSIIAALNAPNADCALTFNIRQAQKPKGSFEAGIMKLREMFLVDHTGHPRIKILESCKYAPDYTNGKPNYCLPDELRRYVFRAEHKADEEGLREKVRKVNDHFIDDLRYSVMLGPQEQTQPLNFGINQYGG